MVSNTLKHDLLTSSTCLLHWVLPQVMMAVGACSALGSPVIGCYMNPDKRFAFVEFRSVEEASNAMAFDGVTCQVCTAAQLSNFVTLYVCVEIAAHQTQKSPAYAASGTACLLILSSGSCTAQLCQLPLKFASPASHY
jgi:hypothetical protein